MKTKRTKITGELFQGNRAVFFRPLTGTTNANFHKVNILILTADQMLGNSFKMDFCMPHKIGYEAAVSLPDAISVLESNKNLFDVIVIDCNFKARNKSFGITAENISDSIKQIKSISPEIKIVLLVTDPHSVRFCPEAQDEEIQKVTEIYSSYCRRKALLAALPYKEDFI